jgi:small conductance mechanosensitive channel
LVLRPFKEGDVVTVAGSTGKVVEVGLFATLLDTPDNRRLILPNNKVFGATIENVTFHDRRRVSLTVGVDYDADMEKTREVLQAAAEGVEGGSDIAIVLGELGASSVDWHVRIWCDTGDYWGVLEAATGAVKAALDGAGIGIPYPQMDVHLDGAVDKAG